MATLAAPVKIELKEALPPEQFLSRVYDELHKAEKGLNPYRLSALILEGKLTKDQLRDFAKDQWWLVKEIQKTHGYIYQNCPIESARKELIKNIIVEEGPPGPTHPELFVQFCEKGLGMSRAQLEAYQPLASTVAALHHFLWVCMTRSWLEAIGAVVIGGEKGGDESRDNPMYGMANALQKHYGLSKEAVSFYTTHAELEQGEHKEEHGEIGPTLLKEYATSRELQADILEAIWEGVMAHKTCNDGLYHHLLGH
jgi:pyrroloquinoline quinone (PQQ) biosynthesis protein C